MNAIPGAGKKRILLVASGGGHLDAAIAILPSLSATHVELVTYNYLRSTRQLDLPVARTHRVKMWGLTLGIGLALSLVVNFFEAAWIMITLKPKVVFSTGAEIAIPVLAASRLFPGIRRVHLETATRVDELSLSGRVLLRLRLCDYFLVQWPDLETKYPGKVRYAGRLF